MTTLELLKLYAAGERDFPETKLIQANLTGAIMPDGITQN